MKTNLLFPNKFKLVGWIILSISTIAGFFFITEIFEFKFLENTKVFAIFSSMFLTEDVCLGVTTTNLSDEIISVLFIIGAMFVAFSREKVEDEFVAKIRMESLMIATYISYAILTFCIFFFYGLGFFYVMIFNMFTVLVIFILRFYYMLNRVKKNFIPES